MAKLSAEKTIVRRWIDERRVVFLGDYAIPLNVELIAEGDGSYTETEQLKAETAETVIENARGEG